MSYETMTEKELLAAKESNKRHIKNWEDTLKMFETSDNLSGLYYIYANNAIKKAKVQNHRIKAELNYRATKREQCGA